jgi:hypothetical protein
VQAIWEADYMPFVENYVSHEGEEMGVFKPFSKRRY